MRFVLKLVIVVLVLFLGVLIGMQQANEGLKAMKGYDDPRFSQAVSIDENNGIYEATFLGEQIGNYPLEEKKKELEQIKAFNFFSKIGKQISEGITDITRKILSTLE